MDDDTDAKMKSTYGSPVRELAPRRPRVTWLNTIQCDLRAYNLSPNEAVDLAQNHPLWRLMSTYGMALRTPSVACQKRKRKPSLVWNRFRLRDQLWISQNVECIFTRVCDVWMYVCCVWHGCRCVSGSLNQDMRYLVPRDQILPLCMSGTTRSISERHMDWLESCIHSSWHVPLVSYLLTYLLFSFL